MIDLIWFQQKLNMIYEHNWWQACKYSQVQAYRKLDDGSYSKNSLWHWISEDQVPTWFEQNGGVLCFQTTARYLEQDKESPQLSNFCGDFDARTDQDFPHIIESIRFLEELLGEIGVPAGALRIWFSGGRSYHFEVPYQYFLLEPKVGLNRVWKQVSETVNQQMPEECFPLDLQMYSNPRMFRMPSSFYPKYGTYKIELHPDEWDLPIDKIRKLAKHPRKLNLWRKPGNSVEQSSEWFDEIGFSSEIARSVPVNAKKLKELPQGFSPVCIRSIRENSANLDGIRNRAQMVDASYSCSVGIEQEGAAEVMDAWTFTHYEQTENHQMMKEFKHHNRSIVSAVYGDPKKYRFSCRFPRSAGLPCAEGDCPIWKENDYRRHDSTVRDVPPEKMEKVEESEPDVSVAQARKEISEMFEEHATSGKITFIRAAPGVGKTTIALDKLGKITRPVIYAAPTHQIIEEQVKERFFQHIKSRADSSANLCIMPAECTRAAQLRHGVIKSVCKSKCEKKFECDYSRQFYPQNSALVHQFLFNGFYMKMLFPKDEADGVVVFDEPGINNFFEDVKITIELLTSKIRYCKEYPAIREMLKLVRDALESCEKGDFFGDAVIKKFEKTAVSRKINLFEKFKQAESEAFAMEQEELDGEIEVHQMRFVDDLLNAIGADLKKLMPLEFRKHNLDEFMSREFKEYTPSVSLEASLDQLKGNLSVKFILENLDALKNFVSMDITISNFKECMHLESAADDLEEIKTYRDNLEELIEYLSVDDVRVLRTILGKYFPVFFEFIDLNDHKKLIPSNVDPFDEPAKEHFNSVMSISNNVLQLKVYRGLRHVESPMFILDPCIRKELLAALLNIPEEELITWDKPVSMKNVKISQVVDGYYGKQTLKQKSVWKKALKALRKLVVDNAEETLIVTWKDLADDLRELQQVGDFDDAVAIEHYFGIEGINRYRDFKRVVLVGTPSWPENQVISAAEAIWRHSAPLDTDMIREWVPYNYKDSEGGGKEAKIRKFADERLNLVMRTFREDEMVQSAHRIRPLLNPKEKEIFLISNLPIKELPPQKLLKLDDLIGSEDSEPFHDLAAAVIQGCSGVWSNLIYNFLQMKNPDFENFVGTSLLLDIYYNKDVPTKPLLRFSQKTCTRHLQKAAVAKGWQVSEVRVKYKKTAKVRVFHDGKINTAKIQEMYSELKEFQENR